MNAEVETPTRAIEPEHQDNRGRFVPGNKMGARSKRSPISQEERACRSETPRILAGYWNEAFTAVEAHLKETINDESQPMVKRHVARLILAGDFSSKSGLMTIWDRLVGPPDLRMPEGEGDDELDRLQGEFYSRLIEAMREAQLKGAN